MIRKLVQDSISQIKPTAYNKDRINLHKEQYSNNIVKSTEGCLYHVKERIQRINVLNINCFASCKHLSQLLADPQPVIRIMG